MTITKKLQAWRGEKKGEGERGNGRAHVHGHERNASGHKVSSREALPYGGVCSELLAHCAVDPQKIIQVLVS